MKKKLALAPTGAAGRAVGETLYHTHLAINRLSPIDYTRQRGRIMGERQPAEIGISSFVRRVLKFKSKATITMDEHNKKIALAVSLIRKIPPQELKKALTKEAELMESNYKHGLSAIMQGAGKYLSLGPDASAQFTAQVDKYLRADRGFHYIEGENKGNLSGIDVVPEELVDAAYETLRGKYTKKNGSQTHEGFSVSESRKLAGKIYTLQGIALQRIPPKLQEKIANALEKTLKKGSSIRPDFISFILDLRSTPGFGVLIGPIEILRRRWK